MALRTNERMVLDARDSVSLNVRQDHQLAAARGTTHRLHSDETCYRAPTRRRNYRELVVLRRDNVLLGKHCRGENSRRRYSAPPVIPGFRSQCRVSSSSECGAIADMAVPTLCAKSGCEQLRQDAAFSRLRRRVASQQAVSTSGPPECDVHILLLKDAFAEAKGALKWNDCGFASLGC
jgi:hypothetical protein